MLLNRSSFLCVSACPVGYAEHGQRFPHICNYFFQRCVFLELNMPIPAAARDHPADTVQHPAQCANPVVPFFLRQDSLPEPVMEVAGKHLNEQVQFVAGIVKLAVLAERETGLEFINGRFHRAPLVVILKNLCAGQVVNIGNDGLVLIPAFVKEQLPVLRVGRKGLPYDDEPPVPFPSRQRNADARRVECGPLAGLFARCFPQVILRVPADPVHDLLYVGCHLSLDNILIAVVLEIGEVTVAEETAVRPHALKDPFFREGCLELPEEGKEPMVAVVVPLFQGEVHQFLRAGDDADLFLVGRPAVVSRVIPCARFFLPAEDRDDSVVEIRSDFPWLSGFRLHGQQFPVRLAQRLRRFPGQAGQHVAADLFTGGGPAADGKIGPVVAERVHVAEAGIALEHGVHHKIDGICYREPAVPCFHGVVLAQVPVQQGTETDDILEALDVCISHVGRNLFFRKGSLKIFADQSGVLCYTHHRILLLVRL